VLISFYFSFYSLMEGKRDEKLRWAEPPRKKEQGYDPLYGRMNEWVDGGISCICSYYFSFFSISFHSFQRFQRSC